MPALSRLDRLAERTDPRSRHGRPYPLVPLLALAPVAILAGNTAAAAVAPFGRPRRHRLGHALGFPHGKRPCAGTFTDPFAELDPDHLDRVIGDWLADRHADGWEHIALDGEVLRGRRDGETATSRRPGYGRIERRTIATGTRPNEYPSAWPRAARVFRLVRERTEKGATTAEVACGFAGRSRLVADAARLLGQTRDRRGIENGWHHTGDETFREDRCRVRRGNAPRVPASPRNVAVSPPRNTDQPSVPAATRERAAFPDRALDLLNAPPSISE